MSPVVTGISRTDLYVRFVSAVHDVLSRDYSQEDQTPEMTAKVINLQQALGCIKFCAVCGSELSENPDHPLYRSCECGEFVIVEVWTNGDVTFNFHMFATETTDDHDHSQPAADVVP